jgi:hypothetical protein
MGYPNTHKTSRSICDCLAFSPPKSPKLGDFEQKEFPERQGISQFQSPPVLGDLFKGQKPTETKREKTCVYTVRGDGRKNRESRYLPNNFARQQEGDRVCPIDLERECHHSHQCADR